jgi:hypothetical protein
MILALNGESSKRKGSEDWEVRSTKLDGFHRNAIFLEPGGRKRPPSSIIDPSGGDEIR